MAIEQESYPVDVCQSFPTLPKRMIPRDNILDTLERVFQSDIDLLLIEGDEGIGRTTLLAQFALRHRVNTFCAFIRPTSRFSYEPSTIRYDLCCQLSSVLRPGEPCEPEQAGEAYFQNLLLRLRRYLRSARYFFLIDGLSDIVDSGIRNNILDLLPIGQGFPVILSADAHLLPSNLIRNMNIKSLEVVNLSLDEVTKYFSDLQLDAALVREIYQMCGKGIPAHLASVRRSIEAGSDPRLLVKEGLSKLFEEEWKQVSGDSLSLRIMSLLAHSRHRLRSDDLARLLGCEPDTFPDRISRFSFLSIEDSTSYVSFISPAFAQFAANKTQSERNAALDLIVQDLISRPETEVAIDNLPSYLHERGKLGETLASLSPDYFDRAIEKGQSLLPLRKKVDIGIDAAFNLRQDGDLVRFGLQKSALKEMEVAQVWRSEIEALIATGRRDVALSLASSATLKEERLHLLAVIARSYKEQGESIDESLLAQMRLLYSQLGSTHFDDRALDIAVDLFFSCPDLAVDLIERVSWTDGGENALDLAYMRLSLAASKYALGRGESADKLETILTRIKNPKLRSFTATVAGGQQNAEEIITEAKNMKATVDQLYLLRYWCVENSEREDATQVMEYSLQLLIGATGYAPNARVLRELATPLSFTEDVGKCRTLVGIFDSQRATLSERGPTEDVVRLQLHLAHAEKRYSVEACQNRLAEVYLDTIQISDLATRASCLGWLLASFATIDPTGAIDAKEQIQALSRDALDVSTDSLLSNTADHYRITRNIIRALASIDQKKSVSLALSLNTVRRREEALLEAIRSVLKRKIKEVDFEELHNALREISDFTLRDQAASDIAEFLARQSGEEGTAIAHLTEFLRSIYGISDPTERCRAISLSYSLLVRAPDTGTNNALRSDLLAKLNEALDQIEDPSSRIDIGYRVARSLAEHSPDLSRRYLERSSTERQSGYFRVQSTESAYQACVRLCTRAFAGLLPRRHDTEADQEKLKELIERIPGISKRAVTWAELAMRFFLSKRSDEGKAIVNQYVRPLLESIPPGNEESRITTVMFLAPALYLTHSLTAKAMLAKLPQPQRDYAFSAIADFILEKNIPSDPYEESEQGYDIDYQDAVDVVELAMEITTDSAVYVKIRDLADTLSSKRKSYRFSIQQRADVIARLKRLAASKLPDGVNIKHQGYAVAAKAQILRLGSTGPKQWQEIAEEGRAIPNISDRAFILAIIAKAMPSRNRSRQEEILEEAIEITRAIPCSYDRIERLSDLASVMSTTFSKLAKRCLNEATKALSGFDEIGGRSTYRQIIDTAFKIDPDFAASLVSLTDDDPARGLARLEMERRLTTLKGKKAFIDEPDSCENLSSEYRSDLPHSAWLALGSLNAGRTATLHLEVTRSAVRLAGSYPLSKGYPILSWVIENAVRRLRETGQASTTLREMFDALVLAAEISGRIGMSVQQKSRVSSVAAAMSVEDKSLVVAKGERDKAYRFVRDWLERCAKKYVKICDGYFGLQDLEVVMLIQSVCPNCEVSILTSRKHHKQEGVVSAFEEYPARWRELSAQEPPKAEIVIVGIEPSGKSPLHDRVLLTEGAGLKLGTSWNSIGKTQESVISVLSKSDAALLERSVDQYLLERRRDYQGMRLRYQVITL